MIIRYATEDIRAIAAVEAECFPTVEAATEKDLCWLVKKNWFIIMQNLDLKMKAYLKNLRMVMLYGTRWDCRFDISYSLKEIAKEMYND